MLWPSNIGNKNYKTYSKVFNSNKHAFKADYFDFVKSKKYNQLFRNQLMAEAIFHFKDNNYDIVRTGLFCYENDKGAVQTGKEFQSMLTDGEMVFTTITYKEFIEKAQKLSLTWEEREWTMMLWARYCGFKLSEGINKQLIK